MNDEYVKVERVGTSITLLQSTMDKIEAALKSNRFPAIRNRSQFLEVAALHYLRKYPVTVKETQQ